ncbi:MAG: hypothetical protein AB7T38_08410 [Nitrospirales bacterium]
MRKKFRQQTVLQEWARVSSVCTDPESQSRLMDLRQQLERSTEKEAASSRAEIQTAHFLIQAGFSVAFLEASGGRTADLQCYAGSHRFFVEITVIQSTQSLVGKAAFSRASSEILSETGDDFFEHVFVRRLLARMAEKAKQLKRYCAPVLLAVSVPDVLSDKGRSGPVPPLDLQRIAGMLVGVLAEVPQFSGILLTCWNAPAQEIRNPIRIRQVHWVTRPPNDSLHPRIRLLANNVFASYEMTAREIRILKEAL